MAQVWFGWKFQVVKHLEMLNYIKKVSHVVFQEACLFIILRPGFLKWWTQMSKFFNSWSIASLFFPAAKSQQNPFTTSFSGWDGARWVARDLDIHVQHDDHYRRDFTRIFRVLNESPKKAPCYGKVGCLENGYRKFMQEKKIFFFVRGTGHLYLQHVGEWCISDWNHGTSICALKCHLLFSTAATTTNNNNCYYSTTSSTSTITSNKLIMVFPVVIL